mgnify:CR=1 FL=1
MGEAWYKLLQMNMKAGGHQGRWTYNSGDFMGTPGEYFRASSTFAKLAGWGAEGAAAPGQVGLTAETIAMVKRSPEFVHWNARIRAMGHLVVEATTKGDGKLVLSKDAYRALAKRKR